MMLKYGMKKMTHARAAMKGLAALFFAAMMLFGVAGAAETDPLKPEDKSYEGGNVVLHKQAERIAPDAWKIDVSATINDAPVEPQQLEVRFVLDFTNSMLGCMYEEDHQLWAQTKIDHKAHKAHSVTTDNVCVYELICTDTHEHVDACYQCTRPLYEHSGTSYCKDHSSGTAVNLPTRMAAEQTAVLKLTDNLPKGTDIRYYSFSGENSKGALVGFEEISIATLRENPAYWFIWNTKNTMLNEGVTRFFNEVGFTNANKKKILIIVTDGESHDGYPSGIVENFKTNQDGSVFVVGFNYHNTQLEALAGNGGTYMHANSANKLVEAFDEIEKAITTMITDPMGRTVNFDVSSIVDTESQVDGSVTYSGNTLYWNPNDGSKIENKKIAYSYTVELNANADISVGMHTDQPLNKDTYFKYGNEGGEMKSALFPQPIAQYALSSVQVMWKDQDGKDIGSDTVLPEYKPTEVETIFSDYEWTTEDGLHEVYTPAFETDYVTITKEIPLADGSGAYYRYVNTTYTADGAALNGVEDVKAKEAKEYQIVHHYMLVTPDAAVISGVKRIEGREFEARDTFTFTLQALTEGAPMPEQTVVTIEPTSGSEAGFVFAPISYTAAGTYEYTLMETAGSIEGMTYDETVHTLTVTVTETDGVITAELTGLPEDAATFTNTYQSKGSLKITKKVEGGITVPADAEFTVTGPNGYSKTVKYSEFTNGEYTLSDLPVGEYTVTEDETTAKVDVYTLTVIGNGTKVNVEKDETAQVTITNTYAQHVGSLKIMKSASGASVPADAEFTVTGPNGYSKTVKYSEFTNGEYTLSGLPVGEYTVTEDETTAQVENYTLTVTIANEEIVIVEKDKTVKVEITNRYVKSVGSLKVSKTVVNGDETKAFTFAVSPAENGGVSAEAWNVWKTKDGNSDTFTLKHGQNVTLGGLPLGWYTVTETNVPAGYTPEQLVQTVEVKNDDSANVVFVNTYAVSSTTADISVTKTLEGRSLKAGEFSFELRNKDGELLQTKTNAADGKVTFEPIEYTAAGTYVYTISEVVPEETKGVTYDTHDVSVTVTVTDNGAGMLTTDVEYVNDTVFINEYVPLAATVDFTATKEMTGRTLKEGEFSFQLTEIMESEGHEPVKNLLQTKMNEANGSVNFDAIEYTTAGTHTYEVSEVEGSLFGVTYDDKVYTVEVEVTDDGEGNLTVETYGKDGIVFKNSYAANGSVMLKVRKTLEGSNLKPGMFSFELKDQTGTMLQTKQNGEDGLVIFDALNYTQADVGKTFVYTISEVDNPNDFFTHDTTVHQISVTVSIGEDGRLEMALEGVDENNEVSFVNGVLPTEFRVTKVWEGGDGEISLTLYADDEKLDPQPVCARDGNVYTYTGLPICDMEGGQIVYWAVETPVEGFMTVYRNSGAFINETSRVYNGGQIINRALTDVRVRKVWNGLRSDEARPPITLTLYRNGVKMNIPTPAPDKDGWYTFPGLLMNDNGKAVVYTVKEEPVQGFVTTYINNGVESTDCAQNGGTIVNSKIPSTGDRSDLAFWMTMLAASGALLALTAVCRRKRMN